MVRQTILPFKLERTEERITARSGLTLYAEFMRAMGVEALVDQHLPQPGSGRGLRPSTYVTPLSLTLYGGGETIEEVREIRDDHTLREAIDLPSIPSSSALGDWLKRMGQRGGIRGMDRVNEGIARKVLRRDHRRSYTLLVDPTIIEAEKREAQMTYLGVKGYRPVVATLKELGLVIASTFKEGNDNGGKVDILTQAFTNMPAGKAIDTVLLDAEYYTDDVMDHLTAQGVRWAIAADKDVAVREAIQAIPEEAWNPLRTRDGLTTDREVAETVHSTNHGNAAFRLIVLRWRASQGDLFTETHHYHCIATNMLDETPEAVVWRYNERAHIENHIKELKGGVGLERMPSGDFAANAIHFAIGIMTYNLFLAQRLLTMPELWQSKTIKSIRWLLVEVGGKLVHHGRQLILRLAASIEKYRLYLEMRQRTYALSSA